MRLLHTSSDRLCDEHETLDRFVELRATLYRGDYYYYPEQDTERHLLLHYAGRPDYRFELILAEDGAGRDVARVLVGRCAAFPFGFFGFFECPEDAGAFTELMDEAARVARGLGASDLLGPLDLNGLHNWQFLTYSESPERWVGDPFHRPYYPTLFARAGWETSDESTSGLIDRQLQQVLLLKLPAVLREIETAGLDIRWRDQVSLEDLLPRAWQLSMGAFTPQANRLVPVDFALFKAQVEPVLRAFDDPMSTLCLFRGAELVGFALTYPNFIHRLCNPDGRKARPVVEPPALRIAAKTVVVAPGYRGGAPWQAMFLLLMQQALARFDGRGGWRRSNVKNPSIRKFSAVGHVTHRYAAFRKDI